MGLCYPSLSLLNQRKLGEHIFDCAHPGQGWLSFLTLLSYGDMYEICGITCHESEQMSRQWTKNSIRITRAHLLLVGRVGPVVAQHTRTLLGEVTAGASKVRCSSS